MSHELTLPENILMRLGKERLDRSIDQALEDIFRNINVESIIQVLATRLVIEATQIRPIIAERLHKKLDEVIQFKTVSKAHDSKILKKPIAELELSIRSKKCLGKLGITTIEMLITKTELDLLKQHGFGRTSLREIKTTLERFGLSLKSE